MGEKLKIEYVSIDSIRPSDRNAKLHPKEQVEQIKRSIEDYGMNDPIGVWHDEIVEGHGRLMACKELGITEVPIIRLEHMSDEQRKQYMLVHNQTTMNSDFDLDTLSEELDNLLDFDAEFYDFELRVDDEHFYNKVETEKRENNILNLGVRQFKGVGRYDMPELKPVYKLPEIKEWIGFNYVLSDDDPEGKAVHFFIDDYQFERIYKKPENYVDKLKEYVCVATPDFSPYGDMPLVTQMFNHYRKQWVGAYLQEKGVTVIPTIRCSTDKRSLEWYLDGVPKGGIVIMSSMWTSDDSIGDISRTEYKTMKDTINPCKIFIYGNNTGRMGICDSDNVEFIESFANRRFK